MGLEKGLTLYSEGASEASIKALDYIQVGDILDEDMFLEYSKRYKYFGVTIKPCSTAMKQKYAKDPQELSDYVIKLAGLNNFAVHELHYEFTTEKKNGKYPHVHFTAVKKGSLYKLYCRGLSIYIEPIYDFTGWVNYCKKDQVINMVSAVDEGYMFLD